MKKQKKRKKAILLLLRRWRQVKREVKRVKHEINAKDSDKQTKTKPQTGSMTKIASFAKGPLGIATLLATGIAAGVLYLQQTSVKIVIINQGCNTITPTVRLPVKIPGIKLPQEPIPNGGSATAQVPALKLNTTSSSKNTIQLKALTFTFQFSIPEGSDVVFNGESLLNSQTQINLRTRKTHEVVLSCTPINVR